MYVHEPRWAALSDDVLAALGAKDSMAAATAAVQSEARSWGVYNSNEGLVIVADSVVDFVSPDGVVHVDELHHWLSAVAFGEHAQASTADRFVAGVNLLAHSIRYGDLELRAHAQTLVSGILVEHPVLLHPRLVIPLRIGTERHHDSVMGALLRTRGGALPSASHGIPAAKLTVFAKSPLITAPFVRNAPRKAWHMGSSRQPRVEVSLQGKVLEKSSFGLGSPHPALLASFLELGVARGDTDLKTKWPFSRAGLGKEQRGMLRQAFVHAAGLSYHSGARGFAQREQAPTFFEQWRASGMHLDEPMREALPNLLVEGALVPWLASVKNSAEEGPPAEMVHENVRRTLNAVVRGGLAEDVCRAAAWLFDEALSGTRRWAAASLPDASTIAALAFLQGLAQAGLKLPEAGVVQGVGLKSPLADGILARWQTAFDICSRTQTMEMVLSAPTLAQCDVGQAPRRRARAGI